MISAEELHNLQKKKRGKCSIKNENVVKISQLPDKSGGQWLLISETKSALKEIQNKTSNKMTKRNVTWINETVFDNRLNVLTGTILDKNLRVGILFYPDSYLFPKE